MISFVVPAYNEERLLGATLDAIQVAAGAAGVAYEVIVADDDSSDRTAEVAESHGARVVRVAHRQIAATRNSGARAATGEYLIFVDADTIVNETAVRAAARALEMGAVGGGAGVRFDEPLPLWARLAVPPLTWLYFRARLAGGCFLFARRDAFERAGGFDESFYASEEIGLSRALRRQGRFVILKERVLSSGRKLRAYSGWKLFATGVRLVLAGRRGVRQRSGLELWYEQRPTEDGRVLPPDRR